MMNNTIKNLVLLFCLSGTTHLLAQKDEVPFTARLFISDQPAEDAIISSISKTGIVTYKRNPRDLNVRKIRAPKLESVYFYKPDLFKEGMKLYHGRNYAEAKEKFIECEKKYKAMDTAPNNYSTRAGFYKMECSRRMMDLEALNTERENFFKDALTRETELQQIEVYAFWEAVRLKEWDRLDRLAQSWEERKVTSNQRAQISYCHGLALENLAKENPKLVSKSLNKYSRVLSADFGASVELVSSAADRMLSMFESDPEVKLAMQLWKTEDEDKTKAGYSRLLEAYAIAKLYQDAGFDAITPLKPAYKLFLNYEPEAKDAPEVIGEDEAPVIEEEGESSE